MAWLDILTGPQFLIWVTQLVNIAILLSYGYYRIKAMSVAQSEWRSQERSKIEQLDRIEGQTVSIPAVAPLIAAVAEKVVSK